MLHRCHGWIQKAWSWGPKCSLQLMRLMFKRIFPQNNCALKQINSVDKYGPASVNPLQHSPCPQSHVHILASIFPWHTTKSEAFLHPTQPSSNLWAALEFRSTMKTSTIQVQTFKHQSSFVRYLHQIPLPELWLSKLISWKSGCSLMCFWTQILPFCCRPTLLLTHPKLPPT